jgi:hypothetical protein
MGASRPEHIRLDRGGDQVALPFQDGRDDQPVGLERPWWAEGQHGVALLDGQIQPAEQPVADAVAAAEDDPPPPRPQHEQPAQLPPAGPLGAALLPLATGPRRHQPHQQPVGEGGQPEGEHRGGVHADRAGQQRLGGGWPGARWVVPGAGEAEEDPEHVDQPDRQVLMRAEEDGGDLADQPHQSAGGEQQGRRHQPEGVGDDVVLGIAVAVTPHPSHLLSRLGWAGLPAGRFGSGAGRRGCSRCWRR